MSEEVGASLPQVPREVSAQLRMLQQPSPPSVETGPQCRSPYLCPFFGRCHDVVPGGASDRDRADIVIHPGLADTLAALRKPVMHLDFETIHPAIPVWRGCRPYDQVPVQFSVHAEPTMRGGAATHFQWLADGPRDPRPGLARALVQALAGAGSIVVYSQPFEEGRLRELRDAVPRLAGELQDIIDRLFDLLPVVRAHVEHPGFEGRFGLKRVAPALVPGLRYDTMEIGEGGIASRTLEAMLLGPGPSPAEKTATRKALLAYCKQDTRATMGVLAWLREAAL